jgi:anti-sigma B factor antagonist
MVKVEDRGDMKLIYVKGEFNAQVGLKIKEIIKEYVQKGTANKFILSFRDIIYINSSGIRELIDIHKYLSNEHKSLYLCEMSKEVRELFSFTYLDNVFKIIDKVEDPVE